MKKLWLIPLFVPLLIGVIAYILFSAVSYGWSMTKAVLEDWIDAAQTAANNKRTGQRRPQDTGGEES